MERENAAFVSHAFSVFVFVVLNEVFACDVCICIDDLLQFCRVIQLQRKVTATVYLGSAGGDIAYRVRLAHLFLGLKPSRVCLCFGGGVQVYNAPSCTTIIHTEITYYQCHQFISAQIVR